MAKYRCKTCMKRFSDERALNMHKKSDSHIAMGILKRPPTPAKQAEIEDVHKVAIVAQEST